MLRRAALVGLFSLAAPALAARTQTPLDFLRTIYEPYKAPDFEGQPFWQAERYFTPTLARAIDRDLREARFGNRPPLLDADPFVDAQDWKIEALVYSTARAGNSVVGSVAFVNHGQARGAVLALERTPHGWRIADITGARGSLRALYRLA